jgi:hypothetical protein
MPNLLRRDEAPWSVSALSLRPGRCIALIGVITATVTDPLVRGDDNSPSDPLLQVARLHALSQSGALTPEKYETKETELLARL